MPDLSLDGNVQVQKYEVDWHESMQQTYEFYVVDPSTWKDTKQLTEVESCSITRDASPV